MKYTHMYIEQVNIISSLNMCGGYDTPVGCGNPGKNKRCCNSNYGGSTDSQCKILIKYDKIYIFIVFVSYGSPPVKCPRLSASCVVLLSSSVFSPSRQPA